LVVRDHLSSQRWLRSAAGGGVAKSFSVSTAFPFVAILFATSIVLVLGSPEAAPAQPRALIGGHMISTVGLPVVRICGPAVCAAALAVGLAMVAMHLTGTFHPPAGIDPLGPVGIGALLLTLFAFAWHNLVAQGANKSNIWPIRWW
jgi:CBS-domain-containing membrane protein